MTDEKGKQGFLFHIITDTGNGHQIQATFNLPVGAKRTEMNEVFDEYFAAVKRQEARTRLPAIEAQFLQQSMLIKGTKAAVDRLRDAPQLNGKRRTADEAQFQQSQAQLDAELSKLELYKRSLEETAKEAEVEVPECIRQAS